MKQDEDYRLDHKESHRRWLDEHPDYYKKWRRNNTDYVQKNRQNQKQRDRKKKCPGLWNLAKMDALRMQRTENIKESAQRESFCPFLAKMNALKMQLHENINESSKQVHRSRFLQR